MSGWPGSPSGSDTREASPRRGGGGLHWAMTMGRQMAAYKRDDEGMQVAMWCDHCGRLVGYELADGGCDSDAVELESGWYCGKCAAEAAWLAWLESTLDAVERLAAAHGWEFDRCRFSGGFNTRSRYYTLEWVCPVCCGDEDGDDCRCCEIKLRISDHGSAYCSEDISLSLEPGGDDHTISDLECRMQRRDG